MNVPRFTAQASLYRTSGQYVNGNLSGTQNALANVQMAFKECVDYCEPCRSGGWRACHEYPTGQCGVRKTTQEACTYCGTCTFSPQGFIQTCTNGGKLVGTKACTLCTDSHLTLPWPAPDICVRTCVGPAVGTISFSVIDCSGVPG
jgi:hypothetical protein